MNILGNSDEIVTFLEKYNLSKLTQKEKEYLNIPLIIKEIESKDLPLKEATVKYLHNRALKIFRRK